MRKTTRPSDEAEPLAELHGRATLARISDHRQRCIYAPAGPQNKSASNFSDQLIHNFSRTCHPVFALLQEPVMRTSAVCLILSAAVLYFANGNNGFSSLDSPTAIPELQGKWNSQLIASMTGKQVSCKEMYVEFRSHSLAMASKKGTKTWMTVNDASVSDNLIRFVAVNAKDNKQPMVIYLRRDGDSLRLVEVRDAKDKKSINELPKDIPESMRDTLQKLLTVTHDMMDKMFTMEKCPEA